MAKLDLHPIAHILWDWNGTLLDDLDLCLAIINGMLSARGLDALPRERYLEIFDFPVRDYYQKIGFDFDQEPFEAVSTEFITRYEQGRPGCRLMAGARETLALLQGLGYTQSILSASKKSYLQKAVGEYQVEGYFEAVLGLDNHHAAGKLSLARAYLRDRGLSPRSTLLVGDTLHDREIAQELGLPCLLIPNGHHSRSRLEAAGAGLLDSLPDLADLFKADPGNGQARQPHPLPR